MIFLDDVDFPVGDQLFFLGFEMFVIVHERSHPVFLVVPDHLHDFVEVDADFLDEFLPEQTERHNRQLQRRNIERRGQRGEEVHERLHVRLEAFAKRSEVPNDFDFVVPRHILYEEFL